jgi:putative spermidine/putrescine transport system ATP-binding protein
VREMLAMTELEPLAARRIDQLSGGQRQRVALARAIAPRPRVLLLDEPLTALDARLRESLRVEIDRLLRSLGITTVYVTHDQAEAMALGDRIAVMAEGRIAQVGTPQQVYNEPADAFVADFIGTMNRIDGQPADGALRFAGGRCRRARRPRRRRRCSDPRTCGSSRLPTRSSRGGCSAASSSATTRGW